MTGPMRVGLESYTVEIRLDDPRRAEVACLLREHVEDMAKYSQPDCVHTLDSEALCAANVSFWTAWEQSELLGCGALLALSSRHGEIKSMRTSGAHLRKGVATKLLEHIILEASRRSYARLSLETGSMAAFAPACKLYERFGFTYCDPFASYEPHRDSVFMTLIL